LNTGSEYHVLGNKNSIHKACNNNGKRSHIMYQALEKALAQEILSSQNQKTVLAIQKNTLINQE